MKDIFEEVEVERIIRDDRYYPRIKPNWLTIYNYRQSLQMGDEFPAIEVAKNNGSYILIDGAHRLEAHKQEKRKKIKCKILDIPEKDYYIESVKRNITNALPFSPIEKRMIIVRLREMKLKDQKIAEIIKMPPMRMEKFLAGSFVKTDLRDMVVKAPLRNRINEDNVTNDLEMRQHIFNATSQEQSLDQVIQLIENKWINLENEHVLKKVYILKKLLNNLLVSEISYN